MGVSKIRFTGGEPLLRKDLLKLVQFAKETPGIESVHLTTNGLLLSKYIQELERAGLSGINISLDTLNPEKFKIITRRDGLDLVLNSGTLYQKSKLNFTVIYEFMYTTI